MLSLFRSLIDRVKVLLAIRAVQELEAETLDVGACRSATLRRLAIGCEAEGLPEVAADLRQKAEELDRCSTSPSLPPASPPPPPSLPPVMPTGRSRRRGS
jgi:hypothetical protein